jgi:hypothetical protein
MEMSTVTLPQLVLQMGCGARACKRPVVRSRAEEQERPPNAYRPHLLFEQWFALAKESELNDANAVALATADPAGTAIRQDGASQGA